MNNKQWNMLKWKIEIAKKITLKYWHFEWFVNQDEFIKKQMEAKYHDEILNSIIWRLKEKFLNKTW